MSKGLGFFIEFSPMVLSFCCLMAFFTDIYGKAKNKKLILLKGATKFLFLRDKNNFRDKKIYVSRFSYIVQIINYILIIATLAVEIFCNFICPDSMIGINVLWFILGYSICGMFVFLTFGTVGMEYKRKLEKQKKELESQSVDDNNIT